MSTDDERIGRRIAALRTMSNISRSWLAGNNCSADDVYEFEAGIRTPSTDLLAAFATRLGCPIAYLSDGVPRDVQIRARISVALAGQTLHQSDINEASRRYAPLAHDPAVLLDANLRRRVMLGLAEAQERQGQFDAAIGTLRRIEADTQDEPGTMVWAETRAALARCHRLNGDPHTAERIATVAMTAGAADSEDWNRGGYIVLASELVSVHTACGNRGAANILAVELANRLTPSHPPEVQLTAIWVLARLGADLRQTDSALLWVLYAYEVAFFNHLEPPGRLLQTCIDLLTNAGEPRASTDAIATLRGRIAELNPISDESAQTTLRHIRQLAGNGQIDDALRSCNVLLGHLPDLSAAMRIQTLLVYGFALTPHYEARLPLIDAGRLCDRAGRYDVAASVWEKVAEIAEAGGDTKLAELAIIRATKSRRNAADKIPPQGDAYRRPPPEADGPDANLRRGL
ncbi:hypothetical protein GCM10029978_066490 [Actinoallomurus acanthiterrae]